MMGGFDLAPRGVHASPAIHDCAHARRADGARRYTGGAMAVRSTSRLCGYVLLTVLVCKNGNSHAIQVRHIPIVFAGQQEYRTVDLQEAKALLQELSQWPILPAKGIRPWKFIGSMLTSKVTCTSKRSAWSRKRGEVWHG
jgi:hypothetical protein